ncbi:MAG TPA: signal peptide peptidase SppA [Chitinophagales bacterium]|nr:signal peptide peptidase SppA [Chitinophagales bacterium]
MKQFLKFVLATITGLFLFMLLGIFIIAGIAASAGKETKATVAANSVLKLDLNYAIPEQTVDNPFAGMNLFNPKLSEKAVGLTEIRECIAKAKTDDNIKGIYLELGLNDNGLATLEAIRQSLADFRKSGKFVYAYGEVLNQKSYYLATAADQIFINPNGGMELKGFGREIMYYKGLFEKLGIEVQDFHCGAFKSAIEPFVRDNMSEPNRQQLLHIYGDVYRQFITSIGKDRKLDTAEVNVIVNNLLAETPQKDVELKLIDGALYYDQVLDKIKEKVGVDKKKDLEVVDLAKYATTIEKNLTADNKVAIVYAEGDIVDGEGKDGEIGGEAYAKIIRKLRNDDKVKAIVLRVNSPGGSALASDVMWRELVLAKKEKPLVVSFGDVAASGGYYIACVGDKIFAQPNTITGSIGVFGLLPNAQKMFKDKLGITFDEVEVTKHGVLGGITKPLDAEEAAFAQRNVEKTYREFKQRVADGRSAVKKEVNGVAFDTAYVETIAQGRVWTGNQAIQNGLVDEIGGLDEAIAYAVKKANLKEYRVKAYPEEKSFSEKLAESFGDAKTQIVKEQLGEQYEVYKTIEWLKKTKGVQARMVYDLGL